MSHVKKVKATIQIDKFIFSSKSVIDDNFTDIILYSKNDIEKSYFQMNNTNIVRFHNYKSAYKYSYNVSYFNHNIGILEIGYKGKYSSRIKFTVNNETFYNGTFQFLPFALEDLYLEMTKISQLDIAIDNYSQNSLKKIYSCIKNEKYKMILNKKCITDMYKIINEIVHWHKGSRRNPNLIKSISAKSVKEDKEFTTYNKLEEIETESHKYYILDYHRKYNPDFLTIYRDEVRLSEDIVSRYQAKHGKITLSKLLDKQFLYELFQLFEPRILEFRDSKGKTVSLYPTPTFESREVILQHHLPECTTSESDFISSYKINESNFLNDNNDLSTKVDKKEINDEEIISPKTIYKENDFKNMRSRKQSQETKNKISLSMKGSKNPNYGKPLSEEHRNKIRTAMINHWAKSY